MNLLPAAQTRRLYVKPASELTGLLRAPANGQANHEIPSRVPDAAAAKRWMLDVAFPYWAQHGIDYENGGVHEALMFDGRPAPHPAKRLRVLARQIYCFSQASILG